MASLMTVRLDKGAAPSLGFRLQGGKDFGTPLVIQKVNGGSPAERAGLIAGDSVIKINNTDVFNLRHKDAQDVIVRAGPSFEVTVQRGGSTWKPSVIPTGALHSAAPLSPVTKTSLAAHRTENIGAIGTGHNVSAKPFSPQLNGTVNGGPKLVNNQYNTPLKLYSEESIAETLSAQTEVLSTGALGVNFKKNEKNYDATNSAVYRMLQEAEKEPKIPESEPDSGVVSSPLAGVTGLRHVSAPETKAPSSNPQLPPGQNICADCERLIVGVFVRIKDKNLHVECFKCSTCGTSLKNVGYYNINNKLYCDVHAKLAARNNPPAPNLVPVTVPPGGRAPVNAISAALSSHSLPSPSPLSPRTNLAQPFQLPQDDKGADLSTPLQNLNVTTDSNNKFNNNLLNSTPLSFNKYLNKAGNYSTTPKPFSSVSAPISTPNYNTLPKAAPLSPLASAPAPSYSPASSADRSVQSFVWPPPPEEPEVPTACPLYFPPPTHIKVIPKPIKSEESGSCDLSEDYSDLEEIDIMAHFQQPKLSVCSEEVSTITGRRSAVECVETISETLETQQLVESVLKNRPPSPPPIDQDVVVQEALKTQSSETVSSYLGTATCDLKRLSEFKPNTVECTLQTQVENAVPQQWESSMVQALRTVPDPFAQIPKKHSSSALASALSIAPAEPFTAQSGSILNPVPLPEFTEPYFPPEHPLVIEVKEPKPPKPESPFVKALQTAPERPFTPANPAPTRKKKDPADEFLKDLPKPQQKLSMRDALTTASERPYSPLIFENVKVEDKKIEVKHIEKQNLQRPLKPAVLPTSFHTPGPIDKPQAPKPFPVRIEERKEEKIEEKQSDVKKSTSLEKHQTHTTVEEASSVEKEPQEGFYPLFTGFSCSFEKMSDVSKFSVEVSTTPPIIHADRSHTPSVKITRTDETKEVSKEDSSEQTKSQQKTSKQVIAKQAEEVVYKKPIPVSSTLHKSEKLPQYQVNLSEDVQAELQMMEKAKIYEAQQKSVSVEQTKAQVAPQIKPIITIQPGDNNNNSKPEQIFKPVSQERPQSMTFSPRPRPLTPSMINKPPPTIPYYQASLVAQEYRAAGVNLLDPTSPAISRSPSPCPDRKSPSPFPTKSATLRPKSPAAGPPPNPLRANIPTPPPRDKKEIKKAKKNVCSFIPQHKSKMSMMEKSQNLSPQMYVAKTEMQNVSGFQSGSEQKLMMESREMQDQMRAQTMVQGAMSTSILEQSHLDHLEQMKKSEAHSTERSSDGLVQVQRKKTVTEEFEHTQNAKMVQIERNVSGSRQYPFRDVKNPPIEGQGIVGLHVTNPQPIVSPFLKAASIAQACTSQVSQTQSSTATPIKHVIAPSSDCPTKHVQAPPSGSAKKPCSNKSNIPGPNAGSGGGRQAGAIGVAPRRGRGVLNTAAIGGARVPLCASCRSQISNDASNKDTKRSSIYLQITEHSIPSYSQVNITIPTSTSPLLDSKGSSPRSDYSSQSSSSSRNPQSIDMARDKIMSELRNALPKVADSPEHSSHDSSAMYSHVSHPRMNTQTVQYTPAQSHLNLPDNLTFANQNNNSKLTQSEDAKNATPVCCQCNTEIVRGPFITALGKIWCPDHFICTTPSCRRPLQDLGFVEENGQLYCEYCFEQYLAPPCAKCGAKIKGDCLKAIGKNFHPECFNCVYCGKLFGNSPFFLEDGSPYCEADWNELFTTKCFACGFPVEAGDRWVEALNNNYHSQCFNCTMCKKNLEGQSFFAKGGRPFCKNHAR